MTKFLKGLAPVLAVLAVLACIGVVWSASGDVWTGGWDRSNSVDMWRIGSTGTLLPGKDNTYSIGSAALSPASIWVDGTATIATLSVSGASTHTGATTQTGALTCSSTVDVAGNLTFGANNFKSTATASTGGLALGGPLTIYAHAAPRGLTVATGTLVWNSTDLQLCVSTAAAVASMVAVADGTTACSH